MLDVSRSSSLHGLNLKQLEATQSFLTKKDTFNVLPTGYGKSVVFAVLPK